MNAKPRPELTSIGGRGGRRRVARPAVPRSPPSAAGGARRARAARRGPLEGDPAVVQGLGRLDGDQVRDVVQPVQHVPDLGSRQRLQGRSAARGHQEEDAPQRGAGSITVRRTSGSSSTLLLATVVFTWSRNPRPSPTRPRAACRRRRRAPAEESWVPATAPSNDSDSATAPPRAARPAPRGEPRRHRRRGATCRPREVP